jgi:hypothetical protein
VKTAKWYDNFSEYDCSGETSVFFFSDTKFQFIALKKLLPPVPVEDIFRCVTSSHIVYRIRIMILILQNCFKMCFRLSVALMTCVYFRD